MKCAKKNCLEDAIPNEPYCPDHQFQGTPSTGYAGGGGVRPQEAPIIITGGSVTIEFDEGQMQKVGPGKHHNRTKKISRIEVTGNSINFAQDTPDGKVTITIFVESDQP